MYGVSHCPRGRVLAWAVFLSAGLLAAAPAAAQGTQTLTINAAVSARAELTISPTTINFPDASPATTPSIPADSTVSVTANVRTTGTPTLRVLAAGPLTAGGDTIAINNITWTASAAPFIAGTMSSTTPQDAATFAQGSGSYSGVFTFALANSWQRAIGNYTQQATYTLTAP
jgi:hypothetical protein